MKRPEGSKPRPGKWACPDAGFQKGHPSLAAYLCDGFWDDGKPRELCSLTVRMSDMVFLSLVDAGSEQSVYCTGPSIPEALQLLEDGLASGAAKWRAWTRKKKG